MHCLLLARIITITQIAEHRMYESLFNSKAVEITTWACKINLKVAEGDFGDMYFLKHVCQLCLTFLPWSSSIFDPLAVRQCRYQKKYEEVIYRKMQQSIKKQFKKYYTFKTKEIATSKIQASQFLFAGAGNSYNLNPTHINVCMHGIQLTVQMCSKRPLLPVCMRYRMVWYYSSFASKPMKIDERYGFITICWQWDQSTYLFLLSRQSQLIEFFSK